MPNLVTHYIVGKKVKDELNIQSNDFLFGCILPDYLNDSHFKEKEGRFLIPNISTFIRNHKIDNYNIFLGFLTHLLLDKYYVNDYVIKEIYDKRNIEENIFTEDKMYKEYSIISSYYLDKYNYSIEDLEKCINPSYPGLNITKFNKDICSIKEYTYSLSDLVYIDTTAFTSFIENIVSSIVNDVITVQKKIIRRNMKIKRKDMLKEDVNHFSNLIHDSLINILDNNYDKYFIYSDFNNEVRTESIINHLLFNNKKVFLPKIIGNDMNAIRYDKNSLLSKNEFGIDEPVGNYDNIDNFVCVMPLLAIDKKGNRIGFGKGYYDKFLKDKSCLKIGICYDYQILEEIPKDTHDVSLDIIISEKRVIDLR